MRGEKNIAEEREMGWFLGQFKANGIFCIKGRFSRLPGLGGGVCQDCTPLNSLFCALESKPCTD